MKQSSYNFYELTGYFIRSWYAKIFLQFHVSGFKNCMSSIVLPNEALIFYTHTPQQMINLYCLPTSICLDCRIHLVIHAWFTAACTGVLCARSIGRWRGVYRITLSCQWPSSILHLFKRWAPPLKTRIPLHPLKRAPSWKCSLCKILSYNSTK